MGKLKGNSKPLYFLISCLFTQNILGQSDIELDKSRQLQNFEGWGTSLCWWANGVGRWDSPNFLSVIGYLTHPDTGLGYNLFRYNIGGGDAPGHDHMRQYGDIPGYKDSEEGEYNWEADSYQRRVLEALIANSQNTQLEAFSNSPPWWMTKSGCVGGNTDGSDNLKEEYFDVFAQYISDVLLNFKNQWGIEFETVIPFNEPSARWWTGPDKNQEGCGFKNNQPRMVKLLGQALVEKELNHTSISAPDENSISEAIASINGYDDSALSYVSQINTHSYNGKQDRGRFNNMVSDLNKKSWQSESGPLSWPGGNQMDVSLWMADVIIKDINLMGVNGWLDWQALDGGVWGSFNTNWTRQTSVPNKRFFMHGQFSRFIRPNSIILEQTAENVLAAYRPETGQIAVVALNSGNSEISQSLRLTGFDLESEDVAHYRTSESENLAQLDNKILDNQILTLELPARSISSYVIKAIPELSFSLPQRKFEYPSPSFKFGVTEKGLLILNSKSGRLRNILGKKLMVDGFRLSAF